MWRSPRDVLITKIFGKGCFRTGVTFEILAQVHTTMVMAMVMVMVMVMVTLFIFQSLNQEWYEDFQNLNSFLRNNIETYYQGSFCHVKVIANPFSCSFLPHDFKTFFGTIF